MSPNDEGLNLTLTNQHVTTMFVQPEKLSVDAEVVSSSSCKLQFVPANRRCPFKSHSVCKPSYRTWTVSSNCFVAVQNILCCFSGYSGSGVLSGNPTNKALISSVVHQTAVTRPIRNAEQNRLPRQRWLSFHFDSQSPLNLAGRSWKNSEIW